MSCSAKFHKFPRKDAWQNCFLKSKKLKNDGCIIHWNFMKLFLATVRGNSKKILAKAYTFKKISEILR